MVNKFKDAGYEPRHDVNIAQGLGMNPEKDNAEYKMSRNDETVFELSLALSPRPLHPLTLNQTEQATNITKVGEAPPSAVERTIL